MSGMDAARAYCARAGRQPGQIVVSPDFPRYGATGSHRHGDAGRGRGAGRSDRRQPGRRADLGLRCAGAAHPPRRAVYPFLCDYQRVWELELARDAYVELEEYFRRFDPLHQHEREAFTKLGYVDVQYLAPRIRGEVMMSVGLMDKICPPSTQFAAYNKITAPKSLRVYPDFGHENLPGNADAVFQFLGKL